MQIWGNPLSTPDLSHTQDIVHALLNNRIELLSHLWEALQNRLHVSFSSVSPIHQVHKHVSVSELRNLKLLSDVPFSFCSWKKGLVRHHWFFLWLYRICTDTRTRGREGRKQKLTLVVLTHTKFSSHHCSFSWKQGMRMPSNVRISNNYPVIFTITDPILEESSLTNFLKRACSCEDAAGWTPLSGS